MQRDIFQSDHSTDVPEAVSAFEDAVWAVLRHQPHALPALERARALGGGMPAVEALHGLALVLLARGELQADVDRRWLAAQSRVHVCGGGSSLERALVAALGLARSGHFVAASDVLSAHARARPQAVIAAKLACSLLFMAGDAGGMLSLTTDLVARGADSQPGRGYLLGCHSFALEEAGRYDEAERIGRDAVALAPDDAWGMHAVGHVYEMRGQVVEGINWFVQHRGSWSGCNNFRLHMAWHQALFHLERGECELALALYDKDIHPAASSDFRDMANAASMLLRMEQLGVAVGPRRWAAVADDAASRVGDATLVFASLHGLLALIGAGRLEEAGELVESLESAVHAPSDQGRVASQVGARLARFLLDGASGRPGAGDPVAMADDLARIGGSGAQRDIFVRALIAQADEAGDAAAVGQLMARRRRMKHDDLFAQRILDAAARRSAAQARQSLQRLGELHS